MATDASKFGPAKNLLAACRVALRGYRRGYLLNLGGRQCQVGIFKSGAAREREHQFRFIATAFARGAETGPGRRHGKSTGREGARERGGGPFDGERRAPEFQGVVFVRDRGGNGDGERGGPVQIERGEGEHSLTTYLERIFRAAQWQQAFDNLRSADFTQTLEHRLPNSRRCCRGPGHCNQHRRRR